MWFSVKKKKFKYEQIQNVGQIKTHIREFLLDSQLPDAIEVSERLGCSPVSDEVLERELEASESRVDAVRHLIPLLYGHATLMSEAFVDGLMATLPKDASEETKVMVHRLGHTTKHVIEDAMSNLLLGSISQLVDLELVKVQRQK